MAPFRVFSLSGKWFRGNCHTHTTVSDGELTPEQIVAAYRAEGYDFLVLTDHRACQESVSTLQQKDFLVINGIEIHPLPQTPAFQEHHIVGIGVEKTPKPGFVQKRSAQAVIRWIERNGGIAVYAHPYWLGHDIRHMQEGREALGMEAYNTSCAPTKGLGDSSVHLDQALSLGMRWKVFAVDDTHRMARDALGGWIMVKARTLTQSAIMNALRKGHFYATCGPEIRSLCLRQGIATLECSPVREVVWHGEGPDGIRVTANTHPLTHVECDLSQFYNRGKYLRLEIADTEGRKAWTNPIWWNKKTRRWQD